MKLVKKSKRKVKRNIKKTKDRANEILKSATADIKSNYLETYNQGEFKEDLNDCQNSWCHEGGMFSEGTPCATVLMDMQRNIGGAQNTVGIPSNLYEVLREQKILDENTSRDEFNEQSKIDHLRSLNSMSEQYKKKCFNENFVNTTVQRLIAPFVVKIMIK